MVRSTALSAITAAWALLSFGCAPPEAPAEQRRDSVPAALIAHAGGGLPHEGQLLDYTNSREALDHAYEQGHRLFELDFQWTTDRQLVALHDWDKTFRKLFHGEPRPLSRAEFLELESNFGLQQMDLTAVLEWLSEHPDSRIVTDIKGNNLAGLALIREIAADKQDRFIPQIYGALQWNPALELGYTDIIFTLYRSDISDSQLFEFVAKQIPFAITMPTSRARSSLPGELKERGVFSYAHTINSAAEYAELRERWGVDGVYTDEIAPDESF